MTDNKKAITGVLDYSIDKQFRGRGLGSIILKESKCLFELINPQIILKGIVKTENISSCKKPSVTLVAFANSDSQFPTLTAKSKIKNRKSKIVNPPHL